MHRHVYPDSVLDRLMRAGFSLMPFEDVRQAAAMKAGGQGDRYTVRIGGQQSYLFFERSTNLAGANIGRWFVERRI